MKPKSSCPFFLPLLLLTALWPPLPLDAQNLFEHGPFQIQRYTEADGLVSAEVTALYKDVHGFLWVATFSGLSRFDGRQFQNFDRQRGLSESNVEVLGNDNKNRLFIRSISNVYGYTGNGLTPFVKYPVRGGFIAAASVTDTGEVWIAYDGKTGVELLSPSGVAMHVPTASPVFQMTKGSSEIYVLEMNGNLSLLRNRTLQPLHTIRAEKPYRNEGLKMYKDPNGTIWTHGANNKHLYAHKEGDLIDSIAVPPQTEWWQWFVGSRRNVYLASDSGSLFQLTNGRWQEILTESHIQGTIYDVLEDKGGTLWVASSSGLLRVTRKQFQTASAENPAYYYTTDEKGRYILRSDSLLYTLPGTVAAYQALRSKTLTNVYVTRKREVWYCTEEAVYYLPYGKRLQRLNTTETYEGNKAIFRFRRVLEDTAGGLWISSYHGIFYKQGDSLRYYWDREGLTEGALYTAAIDNKGIFYTAGVHVYAFVNGRFKNISPQLNLPDEISRLATDQNNAVWVSQGTPVLVKIGQQPDGRFYKADSLHLTLNGLPFNAASHSFDAHNNLWICDNRSLYCYPYKDGRYASAPLFWDEHLSGSPLLYADDSNHIQVISHPLAGAYLRTYAVGNLLNGYQRESPDVHLTAVRLFKEPYDWQGTGFATNALGIPQHLRLQHDQNFLRFYFTGLTDDYSRSVAYRYRLNGYEKAWSPVTLLGEAEYTGLPAGRYTFEAQARSAGGAWSDSLLYPFEIKPVWYLTLWAKVLWSLLGIAAIGGAIYYQQRALKRKAHVKQLLVEEQLKALRAQINPHFLQNTFAFLAHQFYAARNTEAVKAIDRLSAYLRKVLRFSDKATVTLEEELDFAEEYLQMQQQLLHTPFRYSIDVSDDVDLFDVQVPSMLLQPILENALKHGLSPEGENGITISVRTSGNFIRCVISDTGSHRPAGTPPLEGSGKGIALTVDRMQLFYSNKKNKPQFYRQRNKSGGCDAMLLLPLC